MQEHKDLNAWSSFEWQFFLCWVINLATDHLWLLSAGWYLEHLSMLATVYHVKEQYVLILNCLFKGRYDHYSFRPSKLA